MNVAEGLPGGFEPTHWFLAFYERTTAPWIDFLAMGRFKHVSAFVYVPGARVWLWYDAHWQGTTITVLPHQVFIAQVDLMTKEATVVEMIKKPLAGMPIWTRFGFYCVPAIKHLLGLRCVAATPDQLYRFALRNGGMLISGSEDAAIAAGPDAAFGAGPGAIGPC